MGSVCIFKFSLDGDSIWMRQYQAINNMQYGDSHELLDVDQMPDGGFVACGRHLSLNPYLRRGWVIRVDANGCLDASCTNTIKEVDESKDVFIYPNPADNKFTIELGNIDNASTVNVFNSKGEMVLSNNIANQKLVSINTTNLSNGNYSYQLLSTKGIIIKTDKLIVLHKN
jgi:hypothetical protein